MRVINDIVNDILIKGQEHISLTLDEVHTLFGTNDEDEIQGAVMEMINLELRDPDKPDGRGIRVFLSASGRLQAKGDDPGLRLTVNPEVLEVYNG